MNDREYTFTPEGVTAVDYPELPAPRVITARDFMDRLSAATQRAIQTAALTSVDVALLLTQLTGGPVDLDAQRTRDGVAAMQAAGLITGTEAAALLA